MLDALKPRHQDAERDADNHRQTEAEQHAIQGERRVYDHAAVGEACEQRPCDIGQRGQQRRCKISAARQRLIGRRRHGERDGGAHGRTQVLPIVGHGE